MQELFVRTNAIIDALSPKDLRSLCSKKVSERVKVVNDILGGIDSNDKNFGNIFQIIPMALIDRGEGIAALNFIEANIGDGNIYDWKVVEGTINTCIAIRRELLNTGEKQSAYRLSVALQGLFTTLISIDVYKNNPNVFLLIGENAEHQANTDEAMQYYIHAKSLGSVESYFRIIAIHQSEGNHEVCIALLEEGYRVLGDITFLHEMVRFLSKIGQNDAAYLQYQELTKKLNNKVNPFIAYTGRIENDQNLIELQKLMADYISEGTLAPKSILTELAVSASVYIANEFETIGKSIEGYNAQIDEEWIDEDVEGYAELITRRLFLMQQHIFTLRDSRYVEFYLSELYCYSFNGNDQSKEMLYVFFQNNFPEQALRYYQESEEDMGIDLDSMNLFERIRVTIFYISKLFAQGDHYDLILEKIAPMINACLIQEGDDEAVSDNQEIRSNLSPLRDENDLYIGFPTWLQQSYDEYIEYIDKKYGIYYRRALQDFARDGNLDEGIINSTLEAHADIALFYFIEKILQGGLSDDEEPDMNALIHGYNLDTLGTSNALLLAGFLFEGESQFECSIELLVNTPEVFDYTDTLYLITEILILLESQEEVDATIIDLNELCREQYAANDFFEHINNITRQVFDFQDPDMSDYDKGSILMANGFASLLQNNRAVALEYFQKAALFTPMKGYINIGDIYMKQGDYELAMDAFFKSYTAVPTIVAMKRLISTCIISRQFNRLNEYIEIAVIDGHDVSVGVFASLLWQGKHEDAINAIIEIIHRVGQMDPLYPEGTTELLDEYIESVLSRDQNTMDSDLHAILVSYVKLQFYSEEGSIDPFSFIEHFSYISACFSKYKGDEFHIGIRKILGKLVNEMIIPEDNTSPVDDVVELLHIHGRGIHNQMKSILEDYQKLGDVEGITETFKCINMIVEFMILLLQELPDTENYLLGWRRLQNPLIHQMPDIIH